ncbi:MAG: NADP-dependent malic enzyme [Chlamydiota bacterium]|nr:NADP-dependent malic enzyme [Chlamydiota bacterium]
MTDYFKRAVELHKKTLGKWHMGSKVPVKTTDDLSLAYTPGVAAVCEEIAEEKSLAYDLTMKGHTVAVVSDGTAVLGLGDIGPEASLPVMEGKAILFKEFANIDAVPVVLNAHSTEEIVRIVKAIAPTFGGINLEDIKAPKCFEIEDDLQNIGIPVFHDDQHGTAIVLLAALINASKVTKKPLSQMTVVINGAGAAGAAIAKLLCCIGHDLDRCTPVKEVYLCDSKGILQKDRTDMHPYKHKLLEFTNSDNRSGSVFDALKNADVFIGVSVGNLLTAEDIKSMNKDPIIIAMANPIPEIMPEEAKAAGAAIVGTGRSDFPNQVNNVLAFPGIFRGALEAKATKITSSMKIAAAYALADYVKDLSAENILPNPLDKNVADVIANAVKETAIREGVSRE